MQKIKSFEYILHSLFANPVQVSHEWWQSGTTVLQSLPPHPEIQRHDPLWQTPFYQQKFGHVTIPQNCGMLGQVRVPPVIPTEAAEKVWPLEVQVNVLDPTVMVISVLAALQLAT